MSATATAPAAPAPAWLARPAGDWKKLSAAMTAEIPAIAGRPVPVACAPGAGLGAPACYIPAIPVIEVDGSLLGDAPATCDPASPADRERYPVTWGALIHEGAHAAHSRTCPQPRQRASWCTAAHQLEESRAEGRQAARRPGDRRWLRATVTRLILDDFKAGGAAPATPAEAGLAAALVLARGDAGILEPAETAPVAARVEAAISPDRLARLQATWREAHQVADDDARAMTRLARRWCRILGTDPDAAPPAPLQAGLSDLLDAIRDAIGKIEAAVKEDFAPPPPFPAGILRKREEEKQARSTAGQPPATPSAAAPRPRPSPAPGPPATTRPPPPAARTPRWRMYQSARKQNSSGVTGHLTGMSTTFTTSRPAVNRSSARCRATAPSGVKGEHALQPARASQAFGLLGQQPRPRGDHEDVVAQRRPVVEMHPVGFGVDPVDPGLAEGHAGAELPAARSDNPLHAGEPERDEQQPGLVHVIIVTVHHDDLGGLLVIEPAQPVGGQGPAGTAAQDHDSFHKIILWGCRLAAGALVPRPGDHRRPASRVPPG